MHIYCDFDGTISVEDTTDVVLTKLAAPEWEMIEAEWKAGQIGSADCMQRQIPLINASQSELNATLDAMEIDGGFKSFLAFCKQSNLPTSILSDGVDYFINRILANHGISDIKVSANHLEIGHDGSYTLTSPYRDVDCSSNSGVCKCKAINFGSEPRIYVGDGRSDFCAAGYADIVFAKGTLATFCDQQGIAYHAYSSFHDVTAMLSKIIPGVRHHQYGLFAPTAATL